MALTRRRRQETPRRESRSIARPRRTEREDWRPHGAAQRPRPDANGFGFAEPRSVPLTREQEREAVAPLAELLLDADVGMRELSDCLGGGCYEARFLSNLL